MKVAEALKQVEQRIQHVESLLANESVDKLFKAQDSDGVMVALDIPDAIGKQLQAAVKSLLPDGSEPLPVSEMHVTLFYPGALDELQFNQSQLTEAVKTFCASHAPLVGVIGGIARFNGGGESDVTPLVALFDCPDLPQFRQELVEYLHGVGIQEVDLDQEHGYIPHITIAYVPADQEVTVVQLNPLPLTFSEITVAWGSQWRYIPLLAPENVRKIKTGVLNKHCGVCEEDDGYYDAPITNEVGYTGSNPDVEIITMIPDDLPAYPAEWRAEGDESEDSRALVGGALYPREEAAYLLDRSLNFYLVPVAYVGELADEQGAVVHVVADDDLNVNSVSAKESTEYAPQWIEKAGVLDCILGTLARLLVTHPDETDRPILVYNGLTFPTESLPINSPFVDLMRGKSISDDTQRMLQVCCLDTATWTDIRGLVGDMACEAAYQRAQIILTSGKVSLTYLDKGGSGSGNYGHSGRIGERGGSGGGGMIGGGGGYSGKMKIVDVRPTTDVDWRNVDLNSPMQELDPEERSVVQDYAMGNESSSKAINAQKKNDYFQSALHDELRAKYPSGKVIAYRGGQLEGGKYENCTLDYDKAKTYASGFSGLDIGTVNTMEIPVDNFIGVGNIGEQELFFVANKSVSVFTEDLGGN